MYNTKQPFRRRVEFQKKRLWSIGRVKVKINSLDGLTLYKAGSISPLNLFTIFFLYIFHQIIEKNCMYKYYINFMLLQSTGQIALVNQSRYTLYIYINTHIHCNTFFVFLKINRSVPTVERRTHLNRFRRHNGRNIIIRNRQPNNNNNNNEYSKINEKQSRENDFERVYITIPISHLCQNIIK